MKRVFVLLAAISLSGCTTLAPIAGAIVSASQPAAAVGDKVVLEGTRGLVLAHNAAQAGIAIVNPLVRNRVLTSAQVDRYEQIINKVEELGPQGHSVLSAADRATALFNLADELNKLAGR